MQSVGPPSRKKFIDSDPLTLKDWQVTKTKPASTQGSPEKSSIQDVGAKSVNDVTIKQNVTLNWIVALAVVKFDIDQGNVLEAIYPPDILTVPEQKTLSFIAFPDSNAFSAEGAMKYIFKFNKGDGKSTSTSDSDFFFGYTYFQQLKDPTNPRGFSQKSVVILTSLPFVEFYKNIVDLLGQTYFESYWSDENETKNFLKRNYEYISNNWQKLQPGSTNKVDICGQRFAITIPKRIFESRHIDAKSKVFSVNDTNFEEAKLSQAENSLSSPSITEDIESRIDTFDEIKSAETDKNLSSILSDFHLQERGLFQDINLYKIFHGPRLTTLWKLWELVLTNQPILIMSDTPTESSEAVLGLISLIYPLEYQGDYKPYFTIYDPTFKQMQESYEKKNVKSIIVGVTNPLFLKTMQEYPNILHLEQDYLKQQLKEKSTKKPSLLKSVNKALVKPDTSLNPLLIMTGTEEAAAINNALLRKSLRALTESFLEVFEIYFRLQINDIKKFEEKDFLKFLELQKFPFKLQFASQSDIIKVYTKFLKSANFIRYIKNFPNVYFVKSIFK